MPPTAWSCSAIALTVRAPERAGGHVRGRGVRRCCPCMAKAWPGSPGGSTRCRRCSTWRRSGRSPRWREGGSRSRPLYALSLALLFVALFTKQTTITMVGDPGGVGPAGHGSAARARGRGPAPTCRSSLMTAAYLVLRFVLFGQVVRESQLNTEGLAFFAGCSQHHLAHVVAGRVSGGNNGVGPGGRPSALAPSGCCRVERGRTGAARWDCWHSSDRCGGSSAWRRPRWPATNRPATSTLRRPAGPSCSGSSPTSGGFARAARRDSGRSARRRSPVLPSTVVSLHGVVPSGTGSRRCRSSAVVDVRGEVLSSPPGHAASLSGAPARSWEWAVPFSVRPPFTRVDLTGRAFIVTPWLLHCCRGQWFDDTRRILRDWEARPRRRADRRAALEPGPGVLSRDHRSRVSCPEDGRGGAAPAQQPGGTRLEHPAAGGAGRRAMSGGSRGIRDQSGPTPISSGLRGPASRRPGWKRRAAHRKNLPSIEPN